MRTLLLCTAYEKFLHDKHELDEGVRDWSRVVFIVIYVSIGNKSNAKIKQCKNTVINEEHAYVHYLQGYSNNQITLYKIICL